ncbi:MAG: anhydro-N-acetylmuramic acid kinase [Saprospiraceae bacterium]
MKIVGLMSGSSLDGLDVAFCEFQFANDTVAAWQMVAAETMPYSEDWQARLRELPHVSGRDLLLAHAHYGHYVGELVNTFLQKYALQPDFIASHGHTVFHFPKEKMTLQIGDGSAIAAVTGYPVVCDFRAMDVALGGQGAPMAPIADRYLFSEYDFMLNLGGIANITANMNRKYIAFDIGGANQVLNKLVQPLDLEYDAGGKIAASGKLIPTLLQAADALPYHHDAYPKSLGNDWVQEQLIPIYTNYTADIKDKLHTAVVQIARQTAKDIQQIIQNEQFIKDNYRLLATGGGAYNDFLIQCLRDSCQALGVEIVVPDSNIIGFKEAAMIALAGLLRWQQQPNCIASVTGASRDAIGGGIYWVNPALRQ